MKKMSKPESVVAYIAQAPKSVQYQLKQFRKIIKEAAPESEERISYGMPYYAYHGRLAYFAYFKDHVSLFAMPPIAAEFKNKLHKHITGKSTIRFDHDEKLPLALIRKLIQTRVRVNDTKQKVKTEIP